MAAGKPQNVLVLGAGYAGLMAALRLGRRAAGRARVTVVNDSEAFVDRIRLHPLAVGAAAAGALHFEAARAPRRFARHRLGIN